MASNNPENIANEVFDNTPEISEKKEGVEEEGVEEGVQEDVEEGVGEEGVEEEGVEEGVEEEGVGEEGVEEEGVEEGVEEEGVEEGVEEEGGKENEIINMENEKNNTLNVAKNNSIQAVNTLLENINAGLININSLFMKKNKITNKVNGNIQNMVSYQDHLYEDEKYVEYLNYLKLFYELDNKKSIYKKSYENNKLVLTSKDKRIVITPSVVVDLDNYKLYLEKEVHNILFNILQLVENYSMNNTSQKEEFNKYKNSYIIFKAQLNDIQNIEKNYFDKAAKFEEDIANIAIELNILKENRRSVYKQINSKINNEIKDKIMIAFKENNHKIPPIDIINKISSDTQIPIEDIELWFQWIEKSYLYLSNEQKYAQLIKEKYMEEENFKNLTKNFILQKPNIEFS